MPRRYPSCIGTLVSQAASAVVQMIKGRHALLLTRRCVQLHYPGDPLPLYTYHITGRQAHGAAPVLAPRMNLRHALPAPQRGKAPKQHSDPCWLADMEALGPAAHADAGACPQQPEPIAHP